MKCKICKKKFIYQGVGRSIPYYCSTDCFDVRYDPIEPRLIDEFLEFGDINFTDTLYDLGCGDGRIIITAATKFGVTSVGVDTTLPTGIVYIPKVTFVEQNFMETNLTKATIVTLFLSEKVNLSLRDKLWTELPACSRIISYCHAMGNWIPDDTKVVQGNVRENHFYRWNLPVDRGVKPWETDKE